MLVARVWLLIIHLQTGMQSPNVIFLCLPSLDLVHRESQCFFWPIPPGALYVIVISRARGMYGIYCTEARGPCARGLRAINAMHPECA